MRKKITVALMLVFALAFMVGVVASVQAGPGPPPDPIPDGCYWECIDEAWNLCCPTPLGQIRCIATMYWCFGG